MAIFKVVVVTFLTLNFLLISTNAQNTKQDASVYTEREKALIKQLRGRIKKSLTQPIMNEDGYLIRFLRAQDLQLDNAEDMMKRNLVWRRTEKMDTIFSEDWSKWLRDEVPIALNVADYQGKRAITARLGKLDVRKVVLVGKQAELDRYIQYVFERAHYNIQQGFNKTGFIDGYLLFDLAGYAVKTHACLACLPSWVKLVVNYENYYPQLAAKIYVVNVPRIFQNLLDLLKSVLSPHTQGIIQLFDYNKPHWSGELLKVFPKDVLMAAFGGTGSFIPAKSIHNQNYTKIIYYNGENKIL